MRKAEGGMGKGHGSPTGMMLLAMAMVLAFGHGPGTAAQVGPGGLDSALPLLAAAEGADTVTVSVVHSNDVYGELLREAGRDSMGGMAPRVHLIREIRAQGPAVVLDAGDAIGPATLCAWDKGKTMIQLMHLAGYSALTPGNHEFDYGLEVFNERLKEAGFPFLAANIIAQGGVDIGTIGHVLLKVDGVKIGVLGVVTPDLAAQTNPRNVAGLTFEDPVKAAQTAAAALVEQGAEYVIAIAHMPEEATLELAQRVQHLDLIVAGGHEKARRPVLVRSLTRLANGVQIVRTPRNGPFLGLVSVTFVRPSPGAPYRALKADASLLAADPSVPGDPEAGAIISRLETAYDQATGEALGRFASGDLNDQAAAVANLMRWHTGSEIAIVNRGVFQALPADEPVYLRDVKKFVRFDDTLVRLLLKGRDLRRIADRAAGQASGARGLVFAGLDPKQMRVNGRPLIDNEDYRVVTLEFLARGGDAYPEFGQSTEALPTAISLRSLVVGGLKVWRPLMAASFGVLDRKPVWLSGWSVEGAFRRNYVNSTAEEYRDRNERVSYLRGETSIAWNAATDYYLGYEAGPNVLLFENATDFGQIGASFDDLETSTDRFDADLTYRRRIPGLKADPYLSTGISTALTAGNGSRPFLWRNSAGFQKRLGRYTVGQFAARLQRNYAADESDFGAEVNLTYQRGLPQGGRFRSEVRTFFGFTDRNVIAVENYNTFTFPLAGELSLTVRQSNFLYRVSKIGDTPTDGAAMRTDLTVGLAYGLDWKWF